MNVLKFSKIVSLWQVFEFKNYSTVEDFDEAKVSDLIASWRQFTVVGSSLHVRLHYEISF